MGFVGSNADRLRKNPIEFFRAHDLKWAAGSVETVGLEDF